LLLRCIASRGKLWEAVGINIVQLHQRVITFDLMRLTAGNVERQREVPITRLDAGGETYNFKTGTKGGLTCVSKLIRAYGRRVQDKKVPALPIVELRADTTGIVSTERFSSR
jgi:hypothetical protein